MKTVLFVPGFREDINSRDYKSTLAAIEDKGYKVKFVPINWKRTLLSDWTNELNKEYLKHNPADTILAGFSYGSMTAFMTATTKNPCELWLFSLSPYFSDDMPHMKKSWISNIGHRRADNFRILHFGELAPKITCKTLIFVGEVEADKYPLLKKRSDTAHKHIPNSQLITVSAADHDVANKNYIAAIRSHITS